MNVASVRHGDCCLFRSRERARPSSTFMLPDRGNHSSLTLRRRPHMTGKTLCLRVAAFAIAVFVAASAGGLRAGQVATGAVAIDNDDIGGVVTGQRGPEAGVWVIAETTDLPTRL